MSRPHSQPRPKRGGCLPRLVVFVALVGLTIYFWSDIWQLVLPDSIQGEMVDMCYVPGEEGGRLWIVTDDSFYYTSESNCGGTHSISSECFACKHYLYVYDPKAEKVVHKEVIEYPDLPPKTTVVTQGDKVWLIGTVWGDTPPSVMAYDTKTMARAFDTAGFLGSDPKLATGIAELTYEEDPDRLEIVTQDGLEVAYLFREGAVLSMKELDAKEGAEGEPTISRYVLVKEDGGKDRYKLYFVTGPKGKVTSSWHASMVSNPDSLGYYGCTADAMGDGVYLDALVLYQDADGAVILHQDKIGPVAKRSLSLVGKDGVVKWTAPPSALFDELHVTAEDAFSTTFFMTDKIDVIRAGSEYLLSLQGVGMMAFDVATGKVTWQMEL